MLGLVSRQCEEALSGTGVTKDINRWERSAEKEKEKEKEPVKDGASSSKREVVGGKSTHGRWAGLQSFSARLSRPHHAHRRNLRQQMLYRAP